MENTKKLIVYFLFPQCTGAYCQPGNGQLLQPFEVVNSVGFIDASSTAVGVTAEMPRAPIRLPEDFFYPFSWAVIRRLFTNWSNSIYDRGYARVARAVFNVLDNGGMCTHRKSMDHRGYRLYLIKNSRRLPIGYFHHVIGGDSPGASPIVNWVRPLMIGHMAQSVIRMQGAGWSMMVSYWMKNIVIIWYT